MVIDFRFYKLFMHLANSDRSSSVFCKGASGFMITFAAFALRKKKNLYFSLPVIIALFDSYAVRASKKVLGFIIMKHAFRINRSGSIVFYS